MCSTSATGKRLTLLQNFVKSKLCRIWVWTNLQFWDIVPMPLFQQKDFSSFLLLLIFNFLFYPILGILDILGYCATATPTEVQFIPDFVSFCWFAPICWSCHVILLMIYFWRRKRIDLWGCNAIIIIIIKKINGQDIKCGRDKEGWRLFTKIDSLFAPLLHTTTYCYILLGHHTTHTIQYHILAQAQQQIPLLLVHYQLPTTTSSPLNETHLRYSPL